jgi:hypothetical protein
MQASEGIVVKIIERQHLLMTDLGKGNNKHDLEKQ